MKTEMFRRRLALVSILISLAGCESRTHYSAEKMLPMGSALTKLSAAVESAGRYKNPPANMTDEEFLAFATKHDHSLLAPFSDYRVRVLRQDKHAVTLVCSKDGKTALFEDAGCTGPMEKNLWELSSPPPCEFTLKVQDVCVIR